jgi:hypothetical protein
VHEGYRSGGMGLQRESIPIIVEPLKLPEPAREPERTSTPAQPKPSPAEPSVPEKDPARA